MTVYNATLDTQIDPDAPATSLLMYQMRDNPIAMAEGAVGAPYTAAGWHPYDGVTIGDGADGVIYDFDVDGAVASIDTPNFADGFEYMIIGRGVSGSVNSSFRLRWWRETSAAWTGDLTFSLGGGVDLVDFTIEAFAPRMVSRTMFFNVKEASSGAGGEMDALVDSARRLYMATAQKVGKMQVFPPSGNFDAGKIYLFKRRCFV